MMKMQLRVHTHAINLHTYSYNTIDTILQSWRSILSMNQHIYKIYTHICIDESNNQSMIEIVTN